MDEVRRQFARVKSLTEELLAVMSRTTGVPAEPALYFPARLDDHYSTL